MIKRLLCVFTLLVSPLMVAAETDDAASALKQRLGQLHSFEAKFKQQVTDLQGEVLQVADGMLQLSQPNNMVWKLLPPDETKLIADGETVWHIDPFVEQVVAFDQDQAIENNPLILLAQPDSDHWQSFVITQPQPQQFVITSLSEDSQIASLTLKFEQQQLVELVMVDRQQQRTLMTFSEIRQNSDLDPALFRFSLPPGYDLDDQRSPD
ncbi:outer membrane lipoprotein chaperone LolA [Lacimicrobium sp. SS2-24]|uniref:outer membrane lipoprotein chaperone LolA n=1 Tax=Lacimicrobium sp. SS2-24 TaxID=2005569 RepID=UPI000B4A5BB9|nr:outer membrane lipoprotein chaperone LolA [Lacimicrobium sp. SS2-24]